MLAWQRLGRHQSSLDNLVDPGKRSSAASFVVGQQQRQRLLARNPDAVAFRRLQHRPQLVDVDVDSAVTERASMVVDDA